MERKRVVLADDVELFLMMENTFFNRAEFEMITARGGNEVLKIIRLTNPEMVFMLLDMPDVAGDECCRILKSDEDLRHIPIVIVSPSERSEDLERCKISGCDDVVTKPINRQDFMSASRRFLHVMERADKRVPVRIATNYGVIPGEMRNDYSIDLNAGGLFLATESLHEAGALLYLDFFLPIVETPIKCMAEVAWVNGPENRKKPQLPNGMGMRFLDLGKTEREAITKYLESGFSQFN